MNTIIYYFILHRFFIKVARSGQGISPIPRGIIPP